MKCRYRDCDREAQAGWTTCRRHDSAGVSKVQHDRMQRERERRTAALQREADAREQARVHERARQERDLLDGPP